MPAAPAQPKKEYNRLLTIGQAAKFLGVSDRSLRNWDKKGILPSIRSKGGQRRYQLETLKNFASRKKQIKTFVRNNNKPTKTSLLKPLLLGTLALFLLTSSALAFTPLGTKFRQAKEQALKSLANLLSPYIISQEQLEAYPIKPITEKELVKAETKAEQETSYLSYTPNSFYTPVSFHDTVQLTTIASDLIPDQDGVYDLGSSSLEWQDLYIDGTAKIDDLTVDNSATITDDLTVKDELAVSGNTTLSKDLTVSNNISVGGVSSNLTPSTDDKYDLGSSSLKYKDLYIDGTAYLDILTVYQSASLTGNLTLTGHLLSGTDSTYNLGASGNEWANLYVDTLTAGSVGMSGNVTIPDDSWIGLGASAGRIVFDDQTTDEINFLASNVGIGTQTPTYELDVVGDIGMDQYLYHNDDTDTYLGFDTTDAFQMLVGNETMIDITEDDTQDIIEIGDDGDIDIKLSAGADGALFVQGSSGNVGIGTTGPVYKLDVDYGSGSGSQIVSHFKYNKSSEAARILLENSASGDNSEVTIDAKLASSGQSGRIGFIRTNSPGAGDTDLYFSTSTTGTGVTEAMRIKYDGNVGIGETSPAGKMEVEVDNNVANQPGILIDYDDVTNNNYPLEINNAGTGHSIYDDSTAHLTAAGVWTNASSREFKENFTDLDLDLVLDKIGELPVTEWNFKAEDDSIHHLGPVAEDFYQIFGIGEDDKHIASMDTAGIALAGVKGLMAKLTDLQSAVQDFQLQDQGENGDSIARLSVGLQNDNEATSEVEGKIPLEIPLSPPLLKGEIHLPSDEGRTHGVSQAGGVLKVAQTTTFEGKITVLADATFKGKLYLENGIEVKGDFKLTGSLNLTGALTQEFSAAEELAPGEAVALTSSGLKKAKADVENLMPAIGLVVKADEKKAEAAIGGVVGGLKDLSPGSKYYLSTKAGQISLEKPTKGLVQLIGIAKSEKELLIFPMIYPTDSFPSPSPSPSPEVIISSPKPSPNPSADPASNKQEEPAIIEPTATQSANQPTEATSSASDEL